MNNTIFVKRYRMAEAIGDINQTEVFRYAGYKLSSGEPDPQLMAIYEQVVSEAMPVLEAKVCFRRVPLEWEGGMPMLPFSSESRLLAECLKGSDEVVIFAATIGMGIDRLIARNQRLSPTKALFFQALGAERIEAVCNHFCRELRQEAAESGKITSPRYSPGYGDLPLEKQTELFRLLDCSRQIGLSLNESLLMTPSKSVTAIFGIRPGGMLVADDSKAGEEKTSSGASLSAQNEKRMFDGDVCDEQEHKCAYCSKTDCDYRTGE